MININENELNQHETKLFEEKTLNDIFILGLTTYPQITNA